MHTVSCWGSNSCLGDTLMRNLTSWPSLPSPCYLLPAASRHHLITAVTPCDRLPHNFLLTLRAPSWCVWLYSVFLAMTEDTMDIWVGCGSREQISLWRFQPNVISRIKASNFESRKNYSSISLSITIMVSVFHISATYIYIYIYTYLCGLNKRYMKRSHYNHRWLSKPFSSLSIWLL